MNLPQEEEKVQFEPEYDPTDEFIAEMEALESQYEKELDQLAHRGFESEVL